MAGILAAQVAAATGATITGGDWPYYNADDIVYRKSENDGIVSTSFTPKAYKVINTYVKTKDFSGTIKWIDSTGVAATSAGTAPSDATTPWFYDLVPVAGGSTIAGVHESDLLTLAALKDYIVGAGGSFDPNSPLDEWGA